MLQISKDLCDKNLKSNTTSINTIKGNTKGNFKKPTIIDIKEYCTKRKNNVDAETFYHFYESKNWLIGSSKMKNWKSCIITWEKSSRNNNTNDRTTSHRHKSGKDYGDGSF